MLTRLALTVLTLSLSSALAGGGSPAPVPWQGTARPINPPTRCADVLPKPTRDAQGGYHYGSVYAARPLQLASCWKGTLRGKPFILTGYSSAEADTAVVVQYAGRTALTALGTNGSPTVIAFTATVVCFVPNPAKGFLAVVDVLQKKSSPDQDFARRCQSEQIVAALEFRQQVYVGGLRTRYPIGYGVIRTY